MLRTLGRIRLIADTGQRTLPRSKKTRGLLAYLAIEAREVHRGTLTEMLFDDVADPRGALRWSLSRLRSSLGDDEKDALIATRERVRVDPNRLGTDRAWVRNLLASPSTPDLADLEVAWGYFGEQGLDELDLPDCPRFQTWLIGERHAMSDLRQRVGRALLTQLQDEPDRLVVHARKRFSQDPHDEDVLLALVQGLQATGKPDEAVAHYEEYRARRRSHGESVGEALAAWHRRRSPTMSVAKSTAPPVPQPAPAPSLALRIAVDDAFPFVGRAREVLTLTELAARDGTQVALVGGAPGVGKSRLAVHVAEVAAAQGASVCAGRCDEQVPLILGPWRDALKQLHRADPKRFGVLAQGYEGPLAGLLPSLAASWGIAPTEFDTYVAIDALSSVLHRAAQATPLVVVIDDLQWSDEPSRALLASLPRRTPDASILAIATYRSTAGDLDDAVRRWLFESPRLPGVTRVVLQGLNQDAAQQLAETALTPDDARRLGPSLYAQTQGHGLFLTEMIRELQRGGDGQRIPHSITELVRSRFGRLPSAAGDLVTVGAFLGPEFSLRTAAAALDAPLASVLQLVDVAMAADLLHPTSHPTHVRFSHQLVPQAVRELQSVASLAQWHHRCAQGIEREEGDEVDIATHLLGAIPLVNPIEVVDRALVAAEAARMRADFDQSARLYQRVLTLDLPPRRLAEVHVGLGLVLNDSGRTPAANVHFEAALSLAKANGWVDLLVQCALGHGGRSPYRRPGDGRTLEVLAEAASHLEACSPIIQARLLMKQASFLLFVARLDQRDALSREALARVPDAEPEHRLELLEARWIALGCPLRIDELALLDQEIAQLRHTLGRLGTDASMPESVFYWHGDGPALRREVELSQSDPRQNRNIDQWRRTVLNGTLDCLAGDVQRARNSFDEASRLGEDCWGESALMLHALARLCCDVVEGVGPADTATQFESLVARLPSPMAAVGWAWTLVRAGQLDHAAKVLDRVRPASLSWFAEHITGGAALMAAAEVGMALERADWTDAAEIQLLRLEPLMLGLPWAPCVASSHALARIAAYRGDLGAVERYVAQASALYDRLGARALRMRLQADLGLRSTPGSSPA